MGETISRRAFHRRSTMALGLVAATLAISAARVLGANELLHYEYRKPWILA